MYRRAEELVQVTQGLLEFPSKLEQVQNMRIDPSIELRGFTAVKIDCTSNATPRYNHRGLSHFERVGSPTVEIQVVFVGVRGNDEAFVYQVEAVFYGVMPEQHGERAHGDWRDVTMRLSDGRDLDWDPMPPIKPLTQTSMKVKKPEVIDERDVQQLEAAIDAIEKSQ